MERGHSFGSGVDFNSKHVMFEIFEMSEDTSLGMSEEAAGRLKI